METRRRANSASRSNEITHQTRPLDIYQNSTKQWDPLKMIVIGDPNVGKSCLIDRMANGRFDPTQQATQKSDIHRYRVFIDDVSDESGSSGTSEIEDGGTCYDINIWDVPGDHVYRDRKAGTTHTTSITQTHFRNAWIVAIVYDITNRLSYEHAIDYWFRLAEEHELPAITHFKPTPERPHYNVILIGTNSDNEHMRGVSKDEAEQAANSNGMYFVEDSATYSLGPVNVEFVLRDVAYDAWVVRKHLRDSRVSSSQNERGNRTNLPRRAVTMRNLAPHHAGSARSVLVTPETAYVLPPPPISPVQDPVRYPLRVVSTASSNPKTWTDEYECACSH